MNLPNLMKLGKFDGYRDILHKTAQFPPRLRHTNGVGPRKGSKGSGKMESKVKKFRLSATWMRDHLDCCTGNEYWGPRGSPQGEFRGSYWVGKLDQSQINEIFSRCEYYQSFSGDELLEGRWIVNAAWRTVNALRRQGAEYKKVAA